MSSVEEQVIDFYYQLFDRVFTEPFRPRIRERLRQDAVARQIQEAAGAASQALTRFFQSEQLSPQQVKDILLGFQPLSSFVKLQDVANPNRTPEALVEDLLSQHECPVVLSKAGSAAVSRVGLHQTVQVLMLVGPVMMEWQRLSFSTTYEMPRRIVSQLNQITEGLKALATAGQAAADERYELAYRDHLLQRFYRAEVGTVRMTMNLNVDLRELFVMPYLTVRPKKKSNKGGANLEGTALMDLPAARALLTRSEALDATGRSSKQRQTIAAINQVRKSARNVMVGTPGSGKSTFFEWLQLSIANVDEELMSSSGQVIPLLLRVRQLEPKKLPQGRELIEKATHSRDRATLMPEGWIHRQMKAGRVLFMLDGLDETEPGVRDEYIIPWLQALCKEYPDCFYLISSRPVGYAPGTLRSLKFLECDLLDFRDIEIEQYTRHWCTAIRLAQNEPEDEARREGTREGEQIVTGFTGHPYIKNLAQNPLMLSAICLVNYFEGGELPKDRAFLYKLCVEGLLHHWDRRRGIHSDYSLKEKLRVSRELAIAMQADNRAEYEASKVLKIFTDVLGNAERAKDLLEHIRYRSGLLIERRAGIFAFAHLTFQEYLAARAVYEGNNLKIDGSQLGSQHADARWNEVIALYCGSSSLQASRQLIEILLKQPDTVLLSAVLAEALISSGPELAQDASLRKKVLERIAVAPADITQVGGNELKRFPDDEVTAIANSCVGKITTNLESEALRWLLFTRYDKIDGRRLTKRLRRWRTLTPIQLCELLYLAHLRSPDALLEEIAAYDDIYSARGPVYRDRTPYESQAEVAFRALSFRFRTTVVPSGSGAQLAFIQTMKAILLQKTFSEQLFYSFLNASRWKFSPERSDRTKELVKLIRQTVRQAQQQLKVRRKKRTSEPVVTSAYKEGAAAIKDWANRVERELRRSSRPQRKPRSTTGKSKSTSVRPSKKTTRKSPKRRRKV